MLNNTHTIDNFVDVLEVDSFSNSKIGFWDKFINRFAGITQYITWPILAPLFRILFRIKIEGQEIFRDIQGPMMIVSNHISFYDSFLFRLVLGFKTPHLPLRFMAVSKFESSYLNFLAKIGIIDLVYSLFGVFTVVPGLGMDKNLAKAQEILRNGGNIVMYPEGRINKSEVLNPFKKGAAVLYKRTDIKIIPVAFSYIHNKGFRKTIIIKVGKILNLSKSQSPEKITSRFYDAIEKLRV